MMVMLCSVIQTDIRLDDERKPDFAELLIDGIMLIRGRWKMFGVSSGTERAGVGLMRTYLVM